MHLSLASFVRACLSSVGCLRRLVAAAAQTAQSTLRIRVQDETQSALIHATVTITDAGSASSDRFSSTRAGRGRVIGLAPGQYQTRRSKPRVSADIPRSYNVRRGNNNAVATLPVALAEEIIVKEPSAETLREKGFTQTLSARRDRLALGRSGRDGRATAADGRTGRADLRRRLPRRTAFRRRTKSSRSASTPIRSPPSITTPAWCASKSSPSRAWATGAAASTSASATNR